MMGIPIGMALSLALAVLVNQRLRGTVFFRSVFFLPSVCSGVALLMLWSWLYNPEFGLINQSIRALTGSEGPPWLTHTAWAKPALIIMGLWTNMGGRNMLLYLAALQGIDPTLYEAADIDGAGAWAKFRRITWPMLSPTTFFIFIMSVIGGFQTGFEQAYVMTKGGPAGSTTTLSYYIFTEAFVELNMGYASAIAWFLFLLVFLVTLINWKFGGRLVHY
jgi:multiple sugar transport system permease protein